MVRVNKRIMYVKLVTGKQIVNFVSAYAPQVGLSAEEKYDFWDRGSNGYSARVVESQQLWQTAVQIV